MYIYIYRNVKPEFLIFILNKSNVHLKATGITKNSQTSMKLKHLKGFVHTYNAMGDLQQR